MATLAASEQTYVPGQLYQVSLAELLPDPGQPRKYLDPQALDELTASVAQHGIVEPVVFRQDKGTKLLYVVAGERRCAAARKAGLATVPAIFTDTENPEEIAIVENIMRQDLNPVEEAEAFDQLMKNKNYTQEALAAILGKTQASVSSTLSLNRLPQAIRDECRIDPSVPKRNLIEIARAKQERSMFTQYRAFREKQAAEVAKESGQAVQTPKKSEDETLLTAITTLTTRIGKADLTKWTGGKVTDLKTAITALNTAAAERFAALDAAKVTTKTKKKVLS
ncbi:MAG: ParB/RepB/Spo0J family partition protein [Syntrophales bacterium]|nr:ParB/RepB/Spo0J family partition protein [Syntrophales bacterium]